MKQTRVNSQNQEGIHMINDAACMIGDCNKPVKARGMCSMHLWRKTKWGDPMAQTVSQRLPERKTDGASEMTDLSTTALDALLEQLRGHSRVMQSAYKGAVGEYIGRDCGEAADAIAALRAENMCDACAGTGKPASGRTCMCGGSGKMSDAVRYLREQLARAEAEIERVGGNPLASATAAPTREDIKACCEWLQERDESMCHWAAATLRRQAHELDHRDSLIAGWEERGAEQAREISRLQDKLQHPNPADRHLVDALQKVTDSLKRAEQERDLYRAEMSEAKAAGFESAQDLWTAYKGVEQERDALRADAERYQWLKPKFRAMNIHMDSQHSGWHCATSIGKLRGPTLDAAIDAARQAAGEP